MLRIGQETKNRIAPLQCYAFRIKDTENKILGKEGVKKKLG